MGFRHIRVVIFQLGHVPDGPYKVLLRMAYSTMDEDAVPTYSDGWEPLARAMGRHVPAKLRGAADITSQRRASMMAVNRALRQLETMGYIYVLTPAGGRKPASYALKLPHVNP